MGKRGPEFYDDPSVFATYVAKRSDPNNAVETLEKPVFAELIGDLADLRILDLGCGDAQFGQEALQQGCRAYVGVEGSQNMYRLACANLADTGGKVSHATIEDWPYPVEHFDLVTSRLTLHYIEEIIGVFTNVYRALVPGGRFIFSVEHPVITSCYRAWRGRGLRQDWIVDEYFETGPRVTRWMGGEVVKYHRTVENYYSALRTVNFMVDAVRESRPQQAVFVNDETYQRRKRIPLMLFFSAYRPIINP
jgi:SAM-dependent methyltransferase